MIEKKINHLAIIPDGNRRWAKEKGLAYFIGHKEGSRIAPNLVRHLWNEGVHTVSLWVLSTDNVERRSSEELSMLYKLIEQSVKDFKKEALDKECRMIHLGRKDRLPESLLECLNLAEEETKNGTKGILNMAVDYGGRDEMVRAINQVIKEGEMVTEEKINDFLDTKAQPFPNPDLIIRTSGEQRTSGLMIWQSALCELYFEKVNFPDLTTEKLDYIMSEVSGRDRRYGK